MAMSRFRAPFGASRVPARWGDPFVDLQREVNRVFDDVFRGIGVGPSDEGGNPMAAPRIDIDESEQAIRISADLPGVSKDAVDVSIDEDVLTIRGEKRCERTDEQAHVTERFYGTFQRAIQLPFAPDPDRVAASFENGVLTISLPKESPTQKSHKIEVRAGSDEGKNGPDVTVSSGSKGAKEKSAQSEPKAGSQNVGA
ncbi:MAG TPA: Hsp20/alpha crystallin family protein [Dongiaceae bacterium]|jgi:HSP20 family protein|nr:Hsp20/alpha crystallin family protein [Dongiaceae bacterium]